MVDWQFDVVGLFRGLTPAGAKELIRRIDASLSNLRQNIEKEFLIEFNQTSQEESAQEAIK